MFKILVISILLIPAIVFAHGDGPSIEFVKDGYLLDIGYGQDLMVGNTVRFDLELFEDVTKEPVLFSRAWVRVTKEEKVLFAGSISDALFGKPGLSLALSQEGQHTLFVRFENDENSIVEANLPFVVIPDDSKENSGLDELFLFGAAGLFGVGLGYWFGRKV